MENIVYEEEKVAEKEAEKEYEKVMGLHISKEEALVISLVAVNSIVFLCICYGIWYANSRVEMRLTEERAGFYRQLHSYDKLVIGQYRELDEMNQQMVWKTGKDELPRLKYMTDTNLLEIPMLAPFAYRNANKQLAQKQAAPRTKLNAA